MTSKQRGLLKYIFPLISAILFHAVVFCLWIFFIELVQIPIYIITIILMVLLEIIALIASLFFSPKTRDPIVYFRTFSLILLPVLFLLSISVLPAVIGDYGYILTFFYILNPLYLLLIPTFIIYSKKYKFEHSHAHDIPVN